MDFEERVWNSINIMEKKYNYKPKILINMINNEKLNNKEHGVVEAVKRLINRPIPTEGFTKLWELGALNLTLEAIILEEDWKSLFTEEECSKARKRLNEYGYKT